jgi:hypothetical protein
VAWRVLKDKENAIECAELEIQVFFGFADDALADFVITNKMWGVKCFPNSHLNCFVLLDLELSVFVICRLVNSALNTSAYIFQQKHLVTNGRRYSVQWK